MLFDVGSLSHSSYNSTNTTTKSSDHNAYSKSAPKVRFSKLQSSDSDPKITILKEKITMNIKAVALTTEQYKEIIRTSQTTRSAIASISHSSFLLGKRTAKQLLAGFPVKCWP